MSIVRKSLIPQRKTKADRDEKPKWLVEREKSPKPKKP